MGLYATLFEGYSEKQWEDSVALFQERHKRWGIDTAWFKGKKCLDAGCGGGRYVEALKRLGADVSGIDVDTDACDIARKRTGCNIVNASVLAIPFPDATFDYVVSTGVIHHTESPERALQEITRVLKPGGRLFLAVYGRYGIRWWIRFLAWRYTVAKVIPFNAMYRLFALFGVPANKRYAILDNWYIPYIHRFTEKQMRVMFAKNGYKNVRRIPYDTYDYRLLRNRIYYGAGWQQFYAEKEA